MFLIEHQFYLLTKNQHKTALVNPISEEKFYQGQRRYNNHHGPQSPASLSKFLLSTTDIHEKLTFFTRLISTPHFHLSVPIDIGVWNSHATKERDRQSELRYWMKPSLQNKRYGKAGIAREKKKLEATKCLASGPTIISFSTKFVIQDRAYFYTIGEVMSSAAYGMISV